MEKIIKIFLINFLIVLSIIFLHVFVNFLKCSDEIKQLIKILFYFFLLLFFLYKLNIKLTNLNLKLIFKDSLNLFIHFFSVFTIVYYIFVFFGLLNVTFNLSKNSFLLNYFLLFPIELFILSIFEELFFRKYIFYELRSFKNIYKILISSVLFAACHFSNDIPDLILYFIGSIFFGIVYLIFGRVLVSIVLHFATNIAILFYGLHDEFKEFIVIENSFSILNTSITAVDTVIFLSHVIIVFNMYNLHKRIPTADVNLQSVPTDHNKSFESRNM